jgi:hypothetical protein
VDEPYGERRCIIAPAVQLGEDVRASLLLERHDLVPRGQQHGGRWVGREWIDAGDEEVRANVRQRAEIANQRRETEPIALGLIQAMVVRRGELWREPTALNQQRNDGFAKLQRRPSLPGDYLGRDRARREQEQHRVDFSDRGLKLIPPGLAALHPFNVPPDGEAGALQFSAEPGGCVGAVGAGVGDEHPDLLENRGGTGHGASLQ